jgi:hypothetical protein
MRTNKILGLVFGFLLSVSSVHAAVVAYWRFEPGNLTADSSGNGNTLINGSVTSSGDIAGNAPGTGSAAFNTPGNILYIYPGTLDLSSYTQLTFEWFMKPDSSITSLVWQQANLSDPGGIGVYLNDGTTDSIEGYHRESGLALVTNSVPGGTTSGAWHHYALEIDATNPTSSGIQLYIDGVPAGSFYQVGSLVATGFLNDSFFIGRTLGGGSLFTGKLDEFRISSGLLTPAEFLNAVPEPSVAVLLGLGGALLGRRRMKK